MEWALQLAGQLDAMRTAMAASAAAALPASGLPVPTPKLQQLYKQRAALLLDMPPELAWKLLGFGSTQQDGPTEVTSTEAQPGCADGGQGVEQAGASVENGAGRNAEHEADTAAGSMRVKEELQQGQVEGDSTQATGAAGAAGAAGVATVERQSQQRAPGPSTHLQPQAQAGPAEDKEQALDKAVRHVLSTVSGQQGGAQGVALTFPTSCAQGPLGGEAALEDVPLAQRLATKAKVVGPELEDMPLAQRLAAKAKRKQKRSQQVGQAPGSTEEQVQGSKEEQVQMMVKDTQDLQQQQDEQDQSGKEQVQLQAQVSKEEAVRLQKEEPASGTAPPSSVAAQGTGAFICTADPRAHAAVAADAAAGAAAAAVRTQHADAQPISVRPVGPSGACAPCAAAAEVVFAAAGGSGPVAVEAELAASDMQTQHGPPHSQPQTQSQQHPQTQQKQSLQQEQQQQQQPQPPQQQPQQQQQQVQPGLQIERVLSTQASSSHDDVPLRARIKQWLKEENEADPHPPLPPKSVRPQFKPVVKAQRRMAAAPSVEDPQQGQQMQWEMGASVAQGVKVQSVPHQQHLAAARDACAGEQPIHNAATATGSAGSMQPSTAAAAHTRAATAASERPHGSVQGGPAGMDQLHAQGPGSHGPGSQGVGLQVTGSQGTGPQGTGPSGEHATDAQGGRAASLPPEVEQAEWLERHKVIQQQREEVAQLRLARRRQAEQQAAQQTAAQQAVAQRATEAAAAAGGAGAGSDDGGKDGGQAAGRVRHKRRGTAAGPHAKRTRATAAHEEDEAGSSVSQGGSDSKDVSWDGEEEEEEEDFASPRSRAKRARHDETAARIRARLQEHQAKEFAAQVEADRRELVRVSVRRKLDKVHGRVIREHNLPRFLTDIGVLLSAFSPGGVPVSSLPRNLAEDVLRRALRAARIAHHPDKVQQQLRQQQQQAVTLGQMNASAASRASAQRKALEELIRAEEICKILNSFDFARASAWL